MKSLGASLHNWMEWGKSENQASARPRKPQGLDLNVPHHRCYLSSSQTSERKETKISKHKLHRTELGQG